MVVIAVVVLDSTDALLKVFFAPGMAVEFSFLGFKLLFGLNLLDIAQKWWRLFHDLCVYVVVLVFLLG